MFKSLITLITTATISLITTTASAADQRGWFVGGEFGRTHIELTNKLNSSLTADDNTALFGVYGGYNFTHWFGLEMHINRAPGFQAEGSSTEYTLSGVAITPRFQLLLTDNIGLYARFGLQHFDLAIDESHSNSDSWDGFGAVFGGGVQYLFNSGVAVRLEHSRASMDLDQTWEDDGSYYYYAEDSIELDYSATSVGVHYQF